MIYLMTFVLGTEYTFHKEVMSIKNLKWKCKDKMWKKFDAVNVPSWHYID